MELSINDFKEMMETIRDKTYEQKDYLIQLDSAMGDGDLGLTMTTGFDAATDFMNRYQGTDIGIALMQAGMAMNNAAASTMGTLISTAIIKAGKSVKGKNNVDSDLYLVMATAAVEGIKERGKAKVGDKTILDVFVPVLKTLKKAMQEEKKTIVEAYKAANLIAKESFEATKDMVSKHGRARYYGEKSRGKHDPGSAIAVLITEAIYSYLKCKS